MRWFVYNVIFTAGYLLVLPRFLYRMWRRGGYRKGFLQRFAAYPHEVRRQLAERSRIWIHAVSVGEVNVACRFMAAIRVRRPGAAFVLTTTTSTGYRVAKTKLEVEDVLLYFPVDFPPVIRKAFAALKPAAILLTECELWPNLVRMARKCGIPVILINGRISDSSARGYHALRFFFGPVLRMMDLLLVQGEKDMRGLLAAGAPEERLHVMGSAKLDISPVGGDGNGEASALLTQLWPHEGRLVIVAGSTWDGEEAALISVYRNLRSEFPDCRLILVPRHAERRSDVEDQIRRSGMTCILKTELDADGRLERADPDLLLLDTTGELDRFYRCADIVFVGKSLTAHGGQNFIEPAALGKPVVVGPNLENFPVEVPLFEKAEAFIRVADVEELEEAFRMLLAKPGKRADYGRRARGVVDSGRGAVSGSVDLILERLPARASKMSA